MNAHVVVDLGYGDAGKGTLVDWLARDLSAEIVVRYGGGANCGHNVVLPDGRHHEFRQFGAGTFVPGVRTHLSRFVCVNPFMLLEEERRLQGKGVTDAFRRLSIDPSALLTTPFHVAANQLREIARTKRHGSTGLGLGETRKWEIAGLDVPRVQDCLSSDVLRDRLEDLRVAICADVGRFVPDLPNQASNRLWRELTDEADIDALVEIYTTLPEFIEIRELDYSGFANVIFEGHQGVLLDEWRGTFPFNTWTETTPDNAFRLLGPDYDGDVRIIGVMRGYMTRHGAGPFVTEDERVALDEPHNVTGPWQGVWRQGYTDLVAMRYAVEAMGIFAPDEIAVTHLDRIIEQRSWKVAIDYAGMSWASDMVPPVLHGDEQDWAERQQEMTNKLMQATPIYDEIKYGSADDEVVARIEDTIGIPVTIRSYGPTYEQKQIVEPRELMTREAA